jgi:predicted acyltransferase
MRNHALDLLRGLTIALMIIVNNPGDWKEMFTVLRHAEWHGFLGADIVFPLFLFVAGYAAAMRIQKPIRADRRERPALRIGADARTC